MWWWILVLWAMIVLLVVGLLWLSLKLQGLVQFAEQMDGNLTSLYQQVDALKKQVDALDEDLRG